MCERWLKARRAVKSRGPISDLRPAACFRLSPCPLCRVRQIVCIISCDVPLVQVNTFDNFKEREMDTVLVYCGLVPHVARCRDRGGFGNGGGMGFLEDEGCSGPPSIIECQYSVYKKYYLY